MSLRLGVYASSKPIIGGVHVYEHEVRAIIGNRPDENRVETSNLLAVLGTGPDVNRVDAQSLMIIVVP